MGSAATALARLRGVLPVDKAERAIADREDRSRIRARAHEVARPSRSRKLARDWGSGNNIVGMDAWQLRNQARHLERDLDLARNALNILVQNTCGSGIDVLSAPRKPGGKVDRVLAQEIDALWDAWWDRPEVTKSHDFGRAQQLMARSWFRDGECLFQDLVGPVSYLTHGTDVPYSFEMLEADMLPLDLTDVGRRILQGVERNAWGEPIAYHLYKQHPGESLAWTMETKRVGAEYIGHVALIDRIHQVRGLSVFASSMSRFEDVKDYEESERIAAKVAASMSAVIKKGDAGMYGNGPGSTGLSGEVVYENGVPVREMRLAPGAIFDDLLPGESVETIASNRPNPNAALWRKEQLRAAAGGIGTSYSSLSLDYNGTYSAQRQELVEKWGGYLMLGEQFIALSVRKKRQRFLQALLLSRLIVPPRGWSLANVAASTYVRPVMPWIDPLKEAYAKGEAEDRHWVSPQQNTLLAGNNPNDVLTETADWNERREQLGLSGSDPQPDDSRAALRRDATRAMLTENI